MNKSNLIGLLFCTLLFLLASTIAFADCPACFNMVKVEVTLLDGRIINGYAREETYDTDGFPSMSKILIVKKYYSPKDFLIKQELIEKRGYWEEYFYDESSSVNVVKTKIKSMKIIGERKRLSGLLIGVKKDFLKMILTIKPYAHIYTNRCIIFSYDSNYDYNKLKAEVDKCENRYDDREICYDNIDNLSNLFLRFCEEPDY